MNRRVLIEVAVESVDDALAAEGGGADRLELCAALDLGGLTPSGGLVAEVMAATPLPVAVMLRPRAGDFVYTDYEFRVLRKDLDLMLRLPPAAVVFGVLTPDGSVDRPRCRELVQQATAGGVPCVFHRAFDRTPGLTAALDELIDLGFRRVLTSGRRPTALEGAERIQRLVVQADGRIEVLPCGRVRAADAPSVVRVTGSRQVHGSFAEPLRLPTGRGHRGYAGRSATSREAVAACRAALDKAAAEDALEWGDAGPKVPKL